MSDQSRNQPPALAIRSHTGISGDMLLTGLAVLHLAQCGLEPDSPAGQSRIQEVCARILPELGGCLEIAPKSVNHIQGWHASVNLPHIHEHRALEEILDIIDNSSLSDGAKARSRCCFHLLAECEAAAHGLPIDKVHFHEVGALDSILDICGVCELFQMLDAPELHCAPLPIADGDVMCSHGFLPVPAPATLRLLKNIPVRPFRGDLQPGELLTPTGVALLHVLDAKFGPWPSFLVKESALVYGQREFANVANGVLFALGPQLAASGLLPDQDTPFVLGEE